MIGESELDVGGEVIYVDTDENNSAQVRVMLPCGNECSGCPHGPSEYQVQRDGESLS